MNFSLKNIQWVEFNLKMKITHRRESGIGLFELISSQTEQEGILDNQKYCQLLLEKLLLIHENITNDFLQYHCDYLSNPIDWLRSLETLVKENVNQLYELGFSFKINDIFYSIRTEIKRYSNKNPLQRTMVLPILPTIEKIKNHIATLATYKERRNYLLRMKTDFLQRPPEKNPIEPNLNKQIDLELKFLEDTMVVLEKERSTKSPPIQWKGPVNQLIDIFFQAMQRKNKKGEPYIDIPNDSLVNFILDYFRKYDGSSISPLTVKTILKPGRDDKRPLPEDRIKF